MNISCTHCRKTLRVPDDRIPLDKAFSLVCPGCGRRFAVDPVMPEDFEADETIPLPEGAAAAATNDAPDGGVPDNSFQFLAQGARTAMLCTHTPPLLSHVRKTVEAAGYHALETGTPRDALRQMRSHDFDLVIIDELFGTRDPEMNNVLKYVSQLTMDSRRGMFVVLVSSRFSTGDPMQAFHKSVNLIVNTADVDRMAPLLKRGLDEHEAFYRVFNQEYERINGTL
ncbi:transcriptional regulator [Desulfococcus multivorans]|uniref:Response regulator receiver n=1 Tax=Desulfococcus multivorans DSM 2059 TaxID=1121405 RepID=S7UPU4_DESML|nr:transcriptional regulator [Desulfococcus multivorans]AQV02215.1 hypothetical protein B2D07_16545 [Desulfococcus multivorans]EPR36069.1 response regulator receiver [Desulfococcus multivorans DSM 2059]SJZ37902.1 hypothetical protein SAMN02745446_00294 [Desulfococcus multivorans DSM 2059]